MDLGDLERARPAPLLDDHPSAAMRDFAEPVPYAVVIIEMEEGVRIVSGVRRLELSRLDLDLPVEVVFEAVAEGVRFPFFRPRPD